jgi:KDO2-lipid IV(A) lauroyltransferase
VLAIGAHFDCLELIARKVGERLIASLVYKKSRNSAFNDLVLSRRKTYINKLISHENMRAMVRSLQKKEILWYAPDQDFGRPRSVFTPFFHKEAATLVGSSVLAKLGKAVVLPVFCHRKPNAEGYEFITLPVLENFPSGDDTADASRLNALLVDFIRKTPEQYLWAHRRFKTRPEGDASVY